MHMHSVTLTCFYVDSLNKNLINSYDYIYDYGTFLCTIVSNYHMFSTHMSYLNAIR